MRDVELIDRRPGRSSPAPIPGRSGRTPSAFDLVDRERTRAGQRRAEQDHGCRRSISTGPGSVPGIAAPRRGSTWTIKVSPRDLDRDPVDRGGRAARARERRDAGRRALTLIRARRPGPWSKLVMPKLRVAASAGAAMAQIASRREGRCAWRAPSTIMVKAALRAADVARPGLADLHLAPPVTLDIARAHDADVGGAGRIAP